jgi:hypothetical protein
MSSKPHPRLSADPQLYGAGFVGSSARRAFCAVASRRSVRSRQLASEFASLRVSQVVVCRAGLRSALRRSVRGVMSRSSHCSVAVRSASTAVASRFASLRSISLPNKALVLTAQTLARLGPRSIAAPAAQLGRWAVGQRSKRAEAKRRLQSKRGLRGAALVLSLTVPPVVPSYRGLT